MGALAVLLWAEVRFTLGTIRTANGDLIETQFPCCFRNNRLHHHDALHSARRALRTARRSVRHDGGSAPAHCWRLIKERNDASRCACVANCVVWTRIADHEHVERRDPAFFGKADLQTAQQTRPSASDKSFFFTAYSHHYRRISFL